MEGSWYLGADGRIINRMKVTDFKYLSGYFLIMEKTEKFFLADVLLERLFKPFM